MAIDMWQNQDQLAEIKKIYAKDLSEAEWRVLQAIGKATKLSPYLREIWAVKYGSTPAQIFVGRDGYRKAAQSSPNYDYHFVDAVYKNDSFKINNGVVDHSYSFGDRGDLVGAYCIIQRKSSSKPMFVFAELAEYNTKKSLWLNKPATMIKKVAEAQALRMAFQELFAGTYDESEEFKTTIEVANNSEDNKVADELLNEILNNLKTIDDYNESKDNIVKVLNKVSNVAEFKKKITDTVSKLKEAPTLINEPQNDNN